MHGYIPRRAEAGIIAALARLPVVAILGARQCGKSTETLAGRIAFLELTPFGLDEVRERTVPVSRSAVLSMGLCKRLGGRENGKAI